MIGVNSSDESEPSWLEPELKLKDFRLGSWPFPPQLEKKISSKISKLAVLGTQIFFFLFHLHFHFISEDFCSEY